MNIVEIIAEKIIQDKVINESEIKLLDQAIIADGAVDQDELNLIDSILTKVHKGKIKRAPGDKVTQSDLKEIELALESDPRFLPEEIRVLQSIFDILQKKYLQ